MPFSLCYDLQRIYLRQGEERFYFTEEMAFLMICLMYVDMRAKVSYLYNLLITYNLIQTLSMNTLHLYVYYTQHIVSHV